MWNRALVRKPKEHINKTWSVLWYHHLSSNITGGFPCLTSYDLDPRDLNLDLSATGEDVKGLLFIELSGDKGTFDLVTGEA